LALYYNSPRQIDKFLFGSVPLFRFSADLSWLPGHAFALNPHAAGGAVVSMGSMGSVVVVVLLLDMVVAGLLHSTPDYPDSSIFSTGIQSTTVALL